MRHNVLLPVWVIRQYANYSNVKGMSNVEFRFSISTFAWRESPELAIISSLAYYESVALDHAVNEAVAKECKASFLYESDLLQTGRSGLKSRSGELRKLGRLNIEEVNPHLRGWRVKNHFGKTTLSSPEQDLNLELSALGSLVQHETSALANYATEAVHPTEIRTSISPSSAVELNTTSALANYATKAGGTEDTRSLTPYRNGNTIYSCLDLSCRGPARSMRRIKVGKSDPTPQNMSLLIKPKRSKIEMWSFHTGVSGAEKMSSHLLVLLPGWLLKVVVVTKLLSSAHVPLVVLQFTIVSDVGRDRATNKQICSRVHLSLDHWTWNLIRMFLISGNILSWPSHHGALRLAHNCPYRISSLRLASDGNGFSGENNFRYEAMRAYTSRSTVIYLPTRIAPAVGLRWYSGLSVTPRPVLSLVLLIRCARSQYGGYSYNTFSGPVSGAIREISVPVESATHSPHHHTHPHLSHLHRHPAATQPGHYGTSVDYVAKPDYSFAYGVEDPMTGNSQNRKESRDGDVVKGEYTVLEADGSVRTVTYTADPKNGFQATVHHSAPTSAHRPTVSHSPSPSHSQDYH
uniref:Uncharacterized protein n=1 Tax=Timema douglasi TaxID=61478 RepID=A0A7R8VBG0_TIMDO|nr:unnamed protein product [Timema douglasi]